MRRNLIILLAVAAVAVACSSDDGASVRNLGADGSASASGSAASGSASAASGSAASGSAATSCPSDSASSGAAAVSVDLTEYSITTDLAEAPAGPVTFEVHNEGAEPHEVVVVAADSVDDLPMLDDGSFDESALAAGALVGELEPIASGLTCDVTFDLAPGTYLLVCNIVEEADGDTEAHLAEGMVTQITVTG